MNKWFIGILASALLFISCQNVPPINNLEYVVGQWVNNEIDYTTVPTDSIAVINFGTDFIYTKACGVPQADGRMIWFESIANKSYQVVGSKIIIESLPSISPSVYIRYNIEYISTMSMVYSIDQIIIDGKKEPVPHKLYALEKIYDNFSDVIAGIWQANIAGSSDVLIYDIKDDGKFDFYVYDPINKVYKIEVIDKSIYKLYGRYIVNISIGTIPSEVSDQTAEVWEISGFNYASMVWRAKRQNGTVDIYRLIKIGELP